MSIVRDFRSLIPGNYFYSDPVSSSQWRTTKHPKTLSSESSFNRDLMWTFSSFSWTTDIQSVKAYFCGCPTCENTVGWSLAVASTFSWKMLMLTFNKLLLHLWCSSIFILSRIDLSDIFLRKKNHGALVCFLIKALISSTITKTLRGL